MDYREILMRVAWGAVKGKWNAISSFQERNRKLSLRRQIVLVYTGLSTQR